MAKGGRSEAAKSKTNRGLDTNEHLVRDTETGEERSVTQREYKRAKRAGEPIERVDEDGESGAGDSGVAEDAGQAPAASDSAGSGQDQASGGTNFAADLEDGSDAGEGSLRQGLPEEDSIDVGEVDPNNYNAASTREDVGFVTNPVAGGAIPQGLNGYGPMNGVETTVDSPEQVPTASGPRTGENIVTEGDDAAEGNGGEGETSGR